MCGTAATGLRHRQDGLCKYESGELNIRASVLVELNKIYGCGYDSFFEGLDEAPNLF